ncbi:ABC transporter ATP-binding protein [Acidisoma cellulosilytica]|uniref:ABC transporter ATP-binding protein n=1 Tax=Acidisoma cellulosilyticum TaxID=2802395 RepID=A0A963Z4R1_9PROT|nr:ABC transporter ATP-binding protein [Acidisoma cellulosilyticum]MCB8882609.1 ABC transporter ATP-binding protein [Acidisoma cellulosilyticum]
MTLLSIDNIQARYGRSQVLHDVSINVGPGEIICLLGRNGVGKSTTLKCLMGLLPPNAGEIRFDGQPITGLASHTVARRGIGYVPEERLIFPNLTVAENLSMGVWQTGRGAEIVEATERVLTTFPRLRDRLRARGGTLSGGEQQMLAIGRALMGRPKLLVVDEPTEGLAPVIVRALEVALRELAATGMAVLVIESKLAVARRIASSITVMAKGRTVFRGSPAELLSNEAICREHLHA